MKKMYPMNAESLLTFQSYWSKHPNIFTLNYMDHHIWDCRQVCSEDEVHVAISQLLMASLVSKHLAIQTFLWSSRTYYNVKRFMQ